MADQGFPGQHTTTTTMTATSTTVQTDIRYDPLYLRTLPGMLKVAQIALNFLGFLSIAISGNAGYSQASFFDSVSGFAFWFSGILLALYLFHVVEKFFKIPWLKIELGFCALWTVFYLIASTMVAGLTSISVALGVAALTFLIVPTAVCLTNVAPLHFYITHEAVQRSQQAISDWRWQIQAHFSLITVISWLLAVVQCGALEVSSVMTLIFQFISRFTTFFGFCAMVVYGYDAWLKYQGVVSGQLAQGERSVQKTTSTVTSPAY